MSAPEWPGRASTLESKVESWHEECPNYNVGCVAQPDGIVILDCDVQGLDKRIVQEADQQFPETLIVRSAGKGCLHFYFKQTDRSRELGNRAKAETFDLQSKNKYVVGPGSVLTETGKTYDIVCNTELQLFPDWLADWIEKEAPRAKKPAGMEMSPVNEGFNMEDMLNFYGLTYWQNGDWYNVIGCPGKYGDMHEQCKAPGFIFQDGDLGWCCWATSCDSHGKSAGWVIKRLNEMRIEQGLEPYPKLIWPEKPLDMEAWGVKVEEAPAVDLKKDETFEEEEPFLPSKPQVPIEKYKGKVIVPGMMKAEIVEPATPVVVPDSSKLTLKYPELAFPYESLPPGRLKDLVDKACEGGIEPGLVCPSIMALASALPFNDRMEGAKINLYVCLLALVGAGKDMAIKRAQEVLGITGNPSVYTSYAPSGERSIAMLLGDKQAGTKQNPTTVPGLRRHCIVTTELEDTLAKSRGETSSVLQAMQHYWDHNLKTYADAKKGIQNVDCRLSWLCALPIGDEEISTDAFRLKLCCTQESYPKIRLPEMMGAYERSGWR